MTSFFKKLNTLIQAQINDVIRPLSSEEPDGDSPRKKTARQEVGKALSKDVAMLRKRIDDALDHQKALQARVDKLYAEIARWDDYADKAVAEGREGDAKMALAQLHQAQRNLTQAEDALREHQAVTEDLISRVNYMEYVVNQSQEEESVAPTRTKITVEVDTNEEVDAPTETSEVARETVHVIGQAPASRLEKPIEEKPLEKTPEIPVTPTASVPSTPAIDTTPAAVPQEIPTAKQVQTPPAKPSPAPVQSETATADEEKTTKRKSRYAEVGDKEYAEGLELAKEINEKLDTTREKMAELISQGTPLEPTRDIVEEVKREVDQKAIDDDLARRLARLSKPDDKS